MKKLITLTLVAAALMLASTPAKALGEPYPKGTFIAGGYFGVLPGIGAAITGDYAVMTIWKGHLTGGLMATWNRQPYYDFDLDLDLDNFSMGVNTKKYFHHKFCIAPRVAYGLNITDAFEVHAGLMLGLGIVPHDHMAFCVGDFLGLRYFFTDNLAASFELAPLYAVKYHDAWLQPFSTFVNFGVNFKF